MFSTVFSFRGQLARKTYGKATAILGMALLMGHAMGGLVPHAQARIALIASAVAQPITGLSPLPADTWTLAGNLGLLALVLALVLAHLSLLARRTRDCGFPPAIVLAMYITMFLADFAAAHLLGLRTSDGAPLYLTSVSLAVAAALNLLALLWPSAQILTPRHGAP